MLNEFIGVGRLTSDPVLKTVKIKGENKSVVNFVIAVQRDYKNKDGQKDADFIPVVVWYKLAEICNQYIHKGDLVIVKGRMESRSWQDSEGRWIYVIECIANEVYYGFGKTAKNSENISDPEIDSDIPDLPDID